MNQDDVRPPYVLIERMIHFATPHDGEYLLNLGAGPGMTELLKEASRFIPPRGTPVAGFPISKPWYRREASVTKRIFDEFQAQDWCAHGVKVVSDGSRYYGVARFHPHIPESACPSNKVYDLLAIASKMQADPSAEMREALAVALMDLNDHNQKTARALDESLR